MLKWSSILIFMLPVLLNIGDVSSYWMHFFKFADKNKDLILTMDEFNKASDANLDWKRDAHGLAIVTKHFTDLSMTKTKGLPQENFILFVRERGKGMSIKISLS